MGKELRVGIVGLGIGRLNAKGFAAVRRGRVVALCDLVPDKMDRVAGDLPGPVKTYTDYRRLCRDPEVDAVFVGTPNHLHVPVALEAVRRDKHVMLTKPLSDSVRAAKRLVQAAEAAGVVNMMSLSIRFGVEVQYLGKEARCGRFGELYYARSRSIRRSGIPDWDVNFVRKGGGAFRDMGVHMLDAAWWILGMPQPMTATGVAGARFGPRGAGYWQYHSVPRAFSGQFASDDYSGGFIRFEGGIGLQIESFWASHQADECQMELFGTRAGARLDPLTVYSTKKGKPVDKSVRLPKGIDPFERMADHFVACVLDGVECEAPLRHGLVAQQMLEAVLKSARTGREVRLDRAK